MTQTKKLNSIFKYPGSKRLMLDKLFQHLPRTGDILCEPFVGSAVVSLNTSYRRYLLNDANKDLIQALKIARDEPDALLAELRTLLSDCYNNPNEFYSLRDHFNASTCLSERAILLFYFNQVGFQGLLRVNSKNQLNVPYGDGKSAYTPEKEIYAFADKMVSAEFYSLDFQSFIQMVSQFSGQKNQFIDPPYLSEPNKQSYTQYVAGGFRTIDHQRLDTVLVDYGVLGIFPSKKT